MQTESTSKLNMNPDSDLFDINFLDRTRSRPESERTRCSLKI